MENDVDGEELKRLEFIVYAMSQAIRASAEIEALAAANKAREQRGEALAYTEDDFMNVATKYGLNSEKILKLM